VRVTFDAPVHAYSDHWHACMAFRLSHQLYRFDQQALKRSSTIERSSAALNDALTNISSDTEVKALPLLDAHEHAAALTVDHIALIVEHLKVTFSGTTEIEKVLQSQEKVSRRCNLLSQLKHALEDVQRTQSEVAAHQRRVQLMVGTLETKRIQHQLWLVPHCTTPSCRSVDDTTVLGSHWIEEDQWQPSNIHHDVTDSIASDMVRSRGPAGGECQTLQLPDIPPEYDEDDTASKLFRLFSKAV